MLGINDRLLHESYSLILHEWVCDWQVVWSVTPICLLWQSLYLLLFPLLYMLTASHVIKFSFAAVQQVAWSIAAIYHNSRGEEFRVDPGTLAFSVTLFTIFAFICVAMLMYRRRPDIGGELGGPRTAKALTTMLFVSLWLLYILFSSLEAYCHIQGF